RTQLLTQCSDVNIDGTALSVKTIAPDLIEQLGTGKDDPLAGDQQTQQLKFLEGEHYFVPVHLNNVADRVHVEIAYTIFLLPIVVRSTAAQQSTDAGEQLHHPKRLWNIVVSTDVQSAHNVILTALGSQHDHR